MLVANFCAPTGIAVVLATSVSWVPNGTMFKNVLPVFVITVETFVEPVSAPGIRPVVEANAILDVLRAMPTNVPTSAADEVAAAKRFVESTTDMCAYQCWPA